MNKIFGLMASTLATLTTVVSMASPNIQVIEVRKGDIIAIEVIISGDFIETVQPRMISLKAKENLWVRISANQVDVSGDGMNFRPFTEVAAGSLEVGGQNSSPLTAHSFRNKIDDNLPRNIIGEYCSPIFLQSVVIHA